MMQSPRPLPINQRATPNEEDNLVMAKPQQNIPEMVQDVVDPNIPITPTPAPQPQPVLEAPRAPAQVVEAPKISSADSSFDAIAGQLDQFQSNLQKEAEQRKIEAEKKASLVQQRIDQINSNPVEIDNRSLWAKSSTGQKIVLGLGALLSSLNPNSAKSFQDNIQNTIETDLKLQMDNLNAQRGEKNSLLSQLDKITGDADAAASAYRAQIYGVLANKLQLTAQKAQSKIQREQALMNADLARQQQSLNQAEFIQKLQEKQTEGSIPGFAGSVKDPVAARDFRNKIAEKPNVIKEIDNLMSINKQFGSSLSPSARASAKQSQNLLIGKLREAIVGPGTLSETDRDLLQEAIANPTDFFTLASSNEIKLNKLKESYNNALSAHASALGLKEEGKPSSFRKK